MPKDIDTADLMYFFKSGVVPLTAYKFFLDSGTESYIANTIDIGSYTALAVKRNPIRSEEGTILNEIEIGLDYVDLNFKNQVMSGLFNNKQVEIRLVFAKYTDWSESWSVAADILLFKGYLDEPKGDEHWITMAVIPFPLLDRPYPKRIYQTGCNWTFCNSITCGLSLSTYTTSTTLSAQSDGVTLTCSHGKAANYFVPGYVEIKSGDLQGAVRPVLQNDTTTVTVRIPFDDSISNGVSVDIVKLCAKNYETCENDFSNYSEYGGFPWVPKEPLL